MAWHARQPAEQTGRTIVVTGANSGIGFEAARGLVDRGGHMLLATSGARIVVVSSTEARAGRLSPRSTRQDLLSPAPYDGRQVYRNSKQANLLFAQELHRRCAKARSPVRAVAVHPGASATNLFARQLEQAGHRLLAGASKVVTTELLQSAAAGALSALRALDQSTPSGAFVGPARFAQHRGRPELLEVFDSARDSATAARVWELTERALGTPLPV